MLNLFYSGVSIEINSARDKSLTVVVTGKADSVRKARKDVVQQLQTQASSIVHIPKEHHRFLFGYKGEKLKELQLNTATRISIPRPGDNSDEVMIIGTKEGIETARHEIQLISDEQVNIQCRLLNLPFCIYYYDNSSDPTLPLVGRWKTTSEVDA